MELPDCAEDVRVEPVGEGAFSDLECKALAWERRRPESLVHDAQKRAAAKRDSRDVHRDGGDVDVAGEPQGVLSRRLSHHDASQVVDQMFLLGKGDELVGRDIAPRWMMPAGQRLETPDRPLRIDDRLVGDVDAAVCHRLPEDFDKTESVKACAVVDTEGGDPAA